MRIPKNAKKVFSGEIFDTYQWEQELFDGSTATFERIDRPDTVRTIATVGNEIIIIEDEQPARDKILAFPGGRIDPDEEPLAAAKRELLEETGYASDDWELYLEVQPTNKIDWTIYTFIARNCKKISEPKLDAGERISMGTVSFDECIEILSSEKFRALDLSNDILRHRVNQTLNQLKSRLFPS